jgi:ribosomal protein S27AE
MTFRDDTQACASCGAVLAHVQARLFCQACGGTMVATDELAGMLNELSPADAGPLDGRLAPAAAPVRACPRCGEAMTPAVLYGVSVQRCAAHGAWFDGGGLEAALVGCTAAVEHRAAAAAEPSSLHYVGAAIASALSLTWGIGYGHLIPAIAGAILAIPVVVGAVERTRRRDRRRLQR